MNSGAILVIDDEPLIREGLAKLLRKEGHKVDVAPDGETGLRRLGEERFDVVLTDLRMPGIDGLGVLRHIKDSGLDAEVIVLTGHGSIQAAVEAMKQGAYDFDTKPADTGRLVHVVARAVERQTMLRRARALEAAQPSAGERPFIGESAAMRQVLGTLDRIAASDATVLIQGESGTGKELIARAIHARSSRRAQPMIAVNCAAIPDTLIESELLGYEKGAFTGAARAKPGKFELADGGTLFLDEVAELASNVQAKLLRVLQEREVERLGATRPIAIDVRVVAATNQDLRRLIHERRFRDDLYYRLNVVTVELPPLRRRPEDLMPLAEHFLRVHARRMGKAIEGFSRPAEIVMRTYGWPGNVRELEHAVQRAVIVTTGPLILEPELALPLEQSVSAAPLTISDATLDEMERQWILAAFRKYGGNQSATAAALGIDRSTLSRKLRQYGAMA